MRVFAISDLHTDMRANMAWVEALDASRYSRDVLIVAGDVSNKLDVLVDTMRVLKSKFFEVFFVWGNHDIWDDTDSLDKIDSIAAAMRELGVRCDPTLVDGKVWIIPLESWHCFTEEDQKEQEVSGLDLNRLQAWRDFELCHWPSGVIGSGGYHHASSSSPTTDKFDVHAKLRESRLVARFLVERNEVTLQRIATLLSIRHLSVITFSHFVPRKDLNPPRFTRFPELKAVSVCEQLDNQVRQCRSTVHVFGHTHVRSRRAVDGVEYVQFPLGYPGEGAYCPRYTDLSQNELMRFH